MGLITEPIFGLISLLEIFYLAIVTLVIGYIFMGFVNIRPRTIYHMMHPKKFDARNFWFAVLVAAPGIVIHELAHKFVAMAYGLNAFFQIFPLGLGLALFLKIINSPLLIIAPGYVEIPFQTAAIAGDFAFRLIAFAGPLTNLVLYGLATLIIKYNRKLSTKALAFLVLTKKLNGILFLFNMIPFGPLDGAKVIFGAS